MTSPSSRARSQSDDGAVARRPGADLAAELAAALEDEPLLLPAGRPAPDSRPVDGQRPQRPRVDAETLLAGLNGPQRDAVTHTGGPVLVVAGAGSGKTRVLTRRIAWLVAERNVHPGSILAITFTNKAAAEMRGRVVELVGNRAKLMWVSTFHSACVRILRAEIGRFGIARTFSIYDDADSRRLMQLVCADQGLDPKRSSPRAVLHWVSKLKNELVDPESATSRATNADEHLWVDAYREYQRRLTAANALDFDDLIMTTVHLFQAFPEVREAYRRRFRHVLVDEYQDTNHAQYALIGELCGEVDDFFSGGDDPPATPRPAGGALSHDQQRIEPPELMVVGDSDQSIYAFRGATIRNIRDFASDFAGARTILLEQNYRSTQTILTAANNVIRHNDDRAEKQLWSDHGDGALITGYVADTEIDEAQFVADEVDRLVEAGETTPGQVAVFYRTNAQSRAFEDVFIRVGLPYKVVGGVRFYERKEIRDALAYLRAIANPSDDVSVRRIVNVPKRGIGERAEQAVEAFASEHRIPFSAALKRIDEVPGVATRSAKQIRQFADFLLAHERLVADGLPADQILHSVLTESGYLDELRDSHDPQDETRLENLVEFVSVAAEFVAQAAVVAVDGELYPGVVSPSAGETTAAKSFLDRLDHTPRAGDRPEAPKAEPAWGADTLFGAVGEPSAAEQPDAAATSVPEPADQKPADQEVVELGDELAAGAPEPDASLGAFLERIALVADADQIPDVDGSGGVVTLMTLHTAKGLEFDTVFLTGMEDGIFPHQRSIGDREQLEEERRLAYVGITRARQRLYLTRAVTRTAFGAPQMNPPSTFLAEIPDRLIDWRRLATDVTRWISSSATARSRDRGPRSYQWNNTVGLGSAPPTKRSALSVDAGDRVLHSTFGLGTVVATAGTGDSATADVDFGSAGLKRLNLRLAPLEKLG